jgi:hypothetical protein
MQAASVAEAEDAPSELQKIRDQFQAHRELTSRPLTELGDQYREALVALQDELQKNADLDGLVTVRNELKRFDQEKSPPAGISGLDSVARLQKIYGTGYDEKFAVIEQKLKTAESAFREKLEALMQELTVKGEVEAALEVKSVLEKLGDAQGGGASALEKALVLHFRFDNGTGDVVSDSSDVHNDGRLMGDAKILSTSGNRGRHAVFDGAGDFIEIPHHESLALTTDGTISVWVRPKRMGNMRGLVSKYTPNNSWTFRNWKDAERRKIGFGDNGHTSRSQSELKDDRWTHLVVTVDKGKVLFYFDGKLDSEDQRPAPLVSNTNPVRIGSCYDGRYFNGAIDDVRIYSRALSAEEVALLFDIES